MADNDKLQLANRLISDFQSASRDLGESAKYFEAEQTPQTIGLSTPPEMRHLLAAIGWPRMYIRSIEERLDIEGFRMAGAESADKELWEWWQANDLDVQSSYGHVESLIYGRSFAIISAPDTDDPMMDPTVPFIEIESPTRVWADINPRTGKVRYAIRLIRTSQESAFGATEGDFVTLYLPDSTIGYRSGGQNGWTEEFRVDHNLGVVPVVPILNRMRLTELYGKSEISRELRSVTDAAARTMMNLQATAELMAVPQRLLFGVKPEDLVDDPTNKRKVFEAYIARILAFEDSDGKAQQFSAAELRNFTEVLDQLAKQAATYTGLPPQYLSFASDNPASADAIRASESRLVKLAERKQRIFGGSWERVMRVAMLVMGKALTPEAHRMETLWRDPSTPTFAAKADAVTKLATARTPDGRAILPVEAARIELGYSDVEREQFSEWDKQGPANELASLYGRQPVPASPETPVSEEAA